MKPLNRVVILVLVFIFALTSASIPAFAAYNIEKEAQTMTSTKSTNTVTPSADEVISMLKQNNAGFRHPRLLLDSERVAVLKERVQTQQPYKSWMQGVLDKADAYLEAAPLEYELADNGIRLLYVSRNALLYIENMAFAYLMTGEAKYAEGAIRVMKEVCAFDDWHPYHFLDVAEMAAAVAIGYDWCYNYEGFSAADKLHIKNTIISHALVPVMEDYDEVPGRERTWYWSSKSSAAYPQNWVAVCFGGTTMAALAIGDEDLGSFNDAGRVITEGIDRLKDWIATYAPDGACIDGTGYWEYAISYMVFGTSSLEYSLGTDFGLMSGAEIEGTFNWLSQVMGPAGGFNYDSNNSDFVNSPEYFWYAAKSGNDAYTNYRIDKQLNEWGLPVTYKDILWYESADVDAKVQLANDAVFGGEVQMAVLKSGSSNDDSWAALFGGFKDESSGAQLSTGSFVLDMLGTRWALDLGSEWQTYVDLETPRYKYYRYRAEGHNTVIINPDSSDYDHDATEYGSLKSYQTSDDSASVVYDFTPKLASKGADSWLRAMSVDRISGEVTVSDNLTSSEPMEYYWFMHTEADISISPDGKIATLTKDGKQIEARLVSDDASLVFTQMSAEPLESSPAYGITQTENTGVTKLAVHGINVTAVDMEVVFSPKSLGGNDDDNVARGKKVSTSLPARNAFLPISALTDGSCNYNDEMGVTPDGEIIQSRFVTVSTNAPLEIVIDLGGVYSLSTVSVVERWVRSVGGCYNSLKAEAGLTSMGVTKYTEIPFSGTIATAARDNLPAYTNVDFGGAYADKIRLTLGKNPGNTAQYELFEIMAEGDKVDRGDILNTTAVTFTPQDSAETGTVPQNGSFDVCVYHNMLTPAKVVVALYDEDNELLECKMGTTEQRLGFDVSKDLTIANVKVLSIASFGSLTPLCEAWSKKAS